MAVSLVFAACANVSVDAPESCVVAPLTLTTPSGAQAAATSAPGSGTAALTGSTTFDVGVLGWIRSAGGLSLTFVDGTLTFPAGQAGRLDRIAITVTPSDSASPLPPVAVMSYVPTDAVKQSGTIDLGQAMDTSTLMRYLDAGGVTLTYSLTAANGAPAELSASSRLCVQATAQIQKSAL